MRRIMLLGASVALVALSVVGVGPVEAAGGGTCTLSGTAKFTPGLKTTAQAVNYTFTGKAQNCSGTVKAIKSGSITASGSGAKLTCGGGATKGTATVRWNNGQSSALSFTTSGEGPLVVVNGKVTSGTFSGSKITGALAFAANAVLCATTGLKQATFNGAARIA
jgi:hypothetical protein